MWYIYINDVGGVVVVDLLSLALSQSLHLSE
jgi:hypothetical protein